MMLDLVIEKGEVADGSGGPRLRADVGVQDGRIVALGDLSGEAAHRRVDASGLVTAPGFIDVHTHDDALLLHTGGEPHPKVLQGVTSVITGNCGVSLAPLVCSRAPAPLDVLGQDAFRFASFAAYLAAVEASAPIVNAACLAGHSTLRVAHMADLDRPASESEATAMRDALAQCLRDGAWGLSTGVYYPTACAATADEVIAIARPLTAASGLLTMHIRDEGDRIDSALREAFAIGRALQVPLVLSHHKLVGKRNHGRSEQTLALVEQAAREQEVCLDCYPYDASSTMLLASRVEQSRDVMVTWSRPHPEAAGRSLRELAAQRREAPEETARALSPAGAIYFAMSEVDVGRILAHPLTMVGSDGLAHDAHPHPRLWGTFPRVLGRYVREQKLLTLEAAVHKMTGLSARRFGLPGRGLVAKGFHADLVTFDPGRVLDRATYQDPSLPPDGIHAVYVNGQLACENRQMTGTRPGRVLRRAVR
ncbi:N-acyl-D-amino-acid deacylase family protein [Aquabacterium sp.]|uniref:N-acyl-D-amino-acid deacylase family protein n=1 Tax=Aquabacterium sp. TaxID=1872578 RepID=UPI002C56E255|nr:D-aminoacylase [Aquabacterium sp.]HSW05053.1 D-aminoacylase [Aquabacterium sp.]